MDSKSEPNEVNVSNNEGRGYDDAFAKHGIIFSNVDLYKDAIIGFKAEIYKLIEEGVMSEQAAAKLVFENEINFFKQIITVEYNK